MAFPLTLPPGIVKSSSTHDILGRYADADKIRFVAGRPEKIGGFEKSLSTTTTGKVYGLYGWVTQAGGRISTLGTYIKVYSVVDSLDEITPVRDSGTLGNNPFTTVNTDETVTVAHTSHGIGENGAYVTFSGAAAVGGITPDGEYLATYVDANSYTIEHSSAATSGATGGGASVAYSYDINPGNADTAFGLGFGAGPYGEETFGDPRTGTTGVEFEMRIWSLDKYGNDLILSPSGGTIYTWDQVSADDRATAVTNAPSAVRSMFVTAERYIFALGTTTPMTMAWPDRDDKTAWTVTSTNRANVRTLKSGNKLISGVSMSDTNLIWSDTSLYLAQHLGDTDIVYDTRMISDRAGLLGPMAKCVAGSPSMAFWFGLADFLVYDAGVVRPVPNQMDIRDYVYRNMDRRYASKFWSAWNAKKNEVWFGYVVSGDTEVGNYVLVSLEDWSWSVGTLTRTGMTHIPAATAEVLMTGSDQYLYEHETGFNADGAAMESYIQTGLIDIGAGTQGAGDTDMDIFRYTHDVHRQTGNLTFLLEAFEHPESSSTEDTASLTITPTTVEDDSFMLGGRHVRGKWTSNVLNGDFRLAKPLISIQKGGSR